MMATGGFQPQPKPHGGDLNNETFSGFRSRKTTSRIAQGWWPDPYRTVEDDPNRGSNNNNCEICNAPVTDGHADGLCPPEDALADKNWIALGPKGQRDVRGVANPATDPPHWWRYFHCSCARDTLKHAPQHPNCARPHGPCTDWHLRGKCKREFQCGHCHFHHPELLEKYPDLPAGGVLRRPQRRERLQVLKMAYEEDVKRFLHSEELIADEESDDELIGGGGPYPAPQHGSGSASMPPMPLNRPVGASTDPPSSGATAAGDLAQLLKPAVTCRVANALRTACAPGSEGYTAVKPILEDKALAPIVHRFVELLEFEGQRRCADEDIHAYVREFLKSCPWVLSVAKGARHNDPASPVIDIMTEFCTSSSDMGVLKRRIRELARTAGA